MATKSDIFGTKQAPGLVQEPMDVSARDSLVIDHLPLVRRLCRKFSQSGEPLEDLVQVGTVGLIKAVEKYDPNRGSSLVAFAIPVVVGEIKNYFRDHGWAVKVPRKLQRQKLLVTKAVDRLYQDKGRSPTIAEIAEATGFSQEDVHETFEVSRCGNPLSLDAEIEVNGNKDASTLADFVGGEDPQYDHLIDKMVITNCLHCLDPRERAVIYFKFYGGLTQAQIGGRLGVSQMHVSRIQRTALEKLKQNLVT